MYLYWPVILIGLTFTLICLPVSILYHRSREWFVYSNVSSYCHNDVGVTRVGANAVAVPAVTRRTLSCRVSRLLPRRHVLLLDLYNGGKQFDFITFKDGVRLRGSTRELRFIAESMG